MLIDSGFAVPSPPLTGGNVECSVVQQHRDPPDTFELGGQAYAVRQTWQSTGPLLPAMAIGREGTAPASGATRTSAPPVGEPALPGLSALDAHVFSLGHDAFLRRVNQAIPEAAMMLGSAQSSTEGVAVVSVPAGSVSVRLYGKFSIEAERAWMGVSALYWAYRGGDEDYSRWVAAQPPAKQLTRADFAELHAYTRHQLHNATSLQAALWAILCNDLGKLDQVAALYRQVREHNDSADLDHDQILGRVLVLRPGFFAAFSQLPPGMRADLATGFNSGSDVAHFSHLEMPAIALSGLAQLTPRARDLYVLHSIFDVAGAAAHRCTQGSVTMTHETWGIYQDVIAAVGALNLADGKIDDVYRAYAQRRAERIGLFVDEPDGAILSIIGSMGRLSTPAEGVCLRQAWQSLSNNGRTALRNELGLYLVASAATGVPIQISYGPTLIHNARSTLSQRGDPEANANGLRLGLELMAKVFVGARRAMAHGDYPGRLPPTGLFFVDAREVAARVGAKIDELRHIEVRLSPRGYGASCVMVE